MGKGADGRARQVDLCELGSKSFISVPLAGDGLQVVNKRRDFLFIGIGVNAGPSAKLVYKVEKDDHAPHRVGGESSVVRVPRVGEL